MLKKTINWILTGITMEREPYSSIVKDQRIMALVLSFVIPFLPMIITDMVNEVVYIESFWIGYTLGFLILHAAIHLYSWSKTEEQ